MPLAAFMALDKLNSEPTFLLLERWLIIVHFCGTKDGTHFVVLISKIT